MRMGKKPFLRLHFSKTPELFTHNRGRPRGDQGPTVYASRPDVAARHPHSHLSTIIALHAKPRQGQCKSAPRTTEINLMSPTATQPMTITRCFAHTLCLEHLAGLLSVILPWSFLPPLFFVREFVNIEWLCRVGGHNAPNDLLHLFDIVRLDKYPQKPVFPEIFYDAVAFISACENGLKLRVYLE